MTLKDSNVCKRLGLTPFIGDPCSRDSPWLDTENAIQKSMFDFSVALASNVMWAHLCFSFNFPHVIALLLVRSHSKRRQALGFVEEMVQAIQALEKEYLKNESAFEKLYNDLAFQKMPLTREIIIMLLQCKFQDCMELRELASMMYASSSSTKESCCFLSKTQLLRAILP